jgi:AraC-like DNA-binding protein
MPVFREIEANPALRPYVKSFWTLRGSGLDSQQERILPDGTFDLVFHLGDPFVRDGAKQPQAMLVGEIRRPVLLHPSRHADVLGLRFHVGGASTFLRMPMRELRDSILPLDVILPGLGERVLNARTTEDRIAVIEGELLRRMRPDGSRIRAAVDEIIRRDGDIRMGDLAAHVGATTRTLERLFGNQVGVGPKALARLVRFHAVLEGRDPGYFDDAHRIHEFRAFSGVTPTEFRREQNRMNDAFVGNLQATETWKL